MSLSTWYSNLKFKSKLLLMASSMITALSIILLSIFLVSARAEYRTESERIAEERAVIAAASFEQEWKAIGKAMLKLLVNENFNEAMNTMIATSSSSYDLQDKIQEPLKNIRNSSPLVKSIYFLDNHGRTYNLYEDYITDRSSLTDFDSLNEVSGFGMLPATKSPFLDNDLVIPILIPLCSFNVRSLQIANNRPPELLLVLLLDAYLVEDRITIGRTSFFESVSSLIFNGTEILKPELEVWDDSMTIDIATNIEGLEIRFYIDESSFPPVGAIFVAYLLMGIFIALAIAVLTIRKISEKLTEPLEDMTEAVEMIAERRYDYSLEARHNDETGTLIRSINEMYATLEQQIEQIRKDEAMKYLYRSQMLTLEIHPHFIYNTLEMIDMEVLGGNNEAASDMLETFAAFLRYTLNNRRDWSTLKQEYEYIDSYMHLMNKRISDHIGFNAEISDGLEDFRIPKSILLPLIENSIKHGFPPEITSFCIPEITITAHREGNEVHISVIDNGMGIDIEKAEASILNREKGHIGIGNVDGRIRLYYHNAEIQFSSIPFYRNEVELVLEGEMQDMVEVD